MKRIVTLLVMLLSVLQAMAGHIAGGEMYYRYIGPGADPNTDRYEITLRLFRECDPVGTAAPLPTDVFIGIFRNGSPVRYLKTVDVRRSTFDSLELQNPLTCIINPPDICYQVATFTFTQDLATSTDGYTFSYQTCCRSNSILNVEFFPIPGGPGPGEGATYMCEIPGTADLPPGSHNTSAVFKLKDTVLICKGKNINVDFSATDADKDSLSYSFCAAYNRGVATDSRNVTPSVPPYEEVTYLPGYSGSQPLGTSIAINPVTGVITGTAPSTGGYVINVCVTEYRNGKPISVHRKDFMIDVADCDFAAADLKPRYITCDGFTMTFKNETNSSQIHSFYWDFGDSSDGSISTEPSPRHTYTDTGTYTVKLVINRGEQCSDSAFTQALVYPGFVPDFTIEGSCFLNPYQFVDLTSTKYGIVDSWRWNFGDPSGNGDTSTLQNPVYRYAAPDTTNVQLIVSNSKGCVDTITRPLSVLDKPAINLPFHDTLICDIDTLQLHASSGSISASFGWSPNINITSLTGPSPYVYPKDTLTYLVTVNDRGCINTDSVKVNVISKVMLDAGNDTTICRTDTIQLLPATNALYFKWSPATALDNPDIKNPLASPLSATQYQVIASVGKCSAVDVKKISVIPYPVANAGNDASICYGKTTQLNATMTASAFSWSPTNSLLNANTLTPTAGPQNTEQYILTVTDTLGCPKPVRDTITVNVIQKVPAFAGNDTIIVAGQPLQLNATGGILYQWSPTIGMDNPDIPNPVVNIPPGYDSVTYQVKVSTPEGCYASDDIKVVVFKTMPDIFVPTAFTPNNDGLNDVLRPKLVGMKYFDFFRVYDRWGLMVFNTSEQNQGWDGSFAGRPQMSGTYVFVARGVDYTGRVLTKKGTVVLIR